MTSMLSHAAASRPVQLAATAVASGVVVTALLLGYQRRTYEARLSALRAEVAADEAELARQRESGPGRGRVADSLEADVENDPEERRALELARRAQRGDYAEEVILEQLTRNGAFLTADGLARVRGAFVIVVGCGGVGSHCAAALARSGVARLRLVDFDQVSLSSLNRHAVATLADVGRPKVQVLARRLQAVAPWVAMDERRTKFDAASAGELLGGWADQNQTEAAEETDTPTFVVDCIDNIDSKVELLRYCHAHQLPVIASMGAGTKSDPTKVVVGDIGHSAEDRLSRATRRRLKLLGITAGIPVVYSTEPMDTKGKAALLPLPDDQYERLGKEKVRELGALPDFRVRILPVLGTMPAVFGYTLANHILLTISGYPYEYSAVKGRDKLYDQILGAIHGFEERLIRSHEKDQSDPSEKQSLVVGIRIPLTPGDVAFLLEDVYRGRSAVSGLPTRTTLVRWSLPADMDSFVVRVPPAQPTDPEQRSTRIRLADLVCMTRDEAARHQQQILLGGRPLSDLYDAATLARIEARRQEAAAYEEYRM